LELLDNPAGKIDERIHNLNRLREDIFNFQGKIRQKLNLENGRSERRKFE
jgi:hypothetical protein